MIRTITLFVICSLSFSFSIVHAQTLQAKITGKLLDEKQSAISFATLSLLNRTDSNLVKGTISNEQGDFIFENINVDKYIIKIEAVGFETKLLEVNQIDTSKLIFNWNNIILQTNIKQLNEVNISKKRAIVVRKSEQTILNISNSILAIGNTALEILSRAPGVTINNEGNISLRGKSE